MDQEKPNNTIATLILICFGVVCFLIGLNLGLILSI